jgi:hypothetical protein
MTLSYKLFYFQGWEYFVLFVIVLVLIFSMTHSFLKIRKYRMNDKKSE